MRIFLTVLALGLALAGTAQDHKSTIEFDLAYRYALRNDGYQSSLQQNGHWAHGGGGFTDYRGKWYQRLYLGGHLGLARTAEGGDFNYRDFGGECRYDLLYQTWKPAWGGTLYTGLSSLTDLSYTQNTLFFNNSWSWRVLSSFGAGAYYQLPFQIKSQKFQFHFHQHLPLVVYGSGPIYTPAIVIDDEPWEALTFLGANQLWRSEYELAWQQSTGNAFGIRYIWSYGQLGTPNTQYMAFHHLGLIMHVAL